MKDSFLFALYAVGNEASQLCELKIVKNMKSVKTYREFSWPQSHGFLTGGIQSTMQNFFFVR